jgi:hypothetical protein
VRERGVVAVELALSVLVLLVPVAILVLSFAPLLERRTLARSLAVEIARSIVISDGQVGPGLERMLWQAEVSGVGPEEVRVAVCGDQLREVVDVTGRCSIVGPTVEVSVEVAVEPNLLPGGPMSVTYTHREPVDPYRSRP